MKLALFLKNSQNKSSKQDEQIMIPRGENSEKVKKKWGIKLFEKLFCVNVSSNRIDKRSENGSSKQAIIQSKPVSIDPLYDFQELILKNQENVARPYMLVNSDIMPGLLKIRRIELGNNSTFQEVEQFFDYFHHFIVLNQLVPNISLIKMIKSKCSDLIVNIQSSSTQAIEEIQKFYLKELRNADENKKYQLNVDFQFSSKSLRQYKAASKIIICPFFKENNFQPSLDPQIVKNFLGTQLGHLLHNNPELMDRVIIILPNDTQIHLIKQLSALYSNNFFLKFENQAYKEKLKQFQLSRSLISVNNHSTRKASNKMESFHSIDDLKKEFVYQTDSFELYTECIGIETLQFMKKDLYQIVVKFGHKKLKQNDTEQNKDGVHQDQISKEVKLSNQLQLQQGFLIYLLFGKIIFFIHIINKNQSENTIPLWEIIQKSSYFSCLFCAQKIIDEQITINSLQNADKYKNYLLLLITSGVIQKDSDLQIVQSIFSIFLNCNKYDFLLPFEEQQLSNKISEETILTQKASLEQELCSYQFQSFPEEKSIVTYKQLQLKEQSSEPPQSFVAFSQK